MCCVRIVFSASGERIILGYIYLHTFRVSKFRLGGSGFVRLVCSGISAAGLLSYISYIMCNLLYVIFNM